MKQRIVLLGPPASGKGTQADRIASAFGIPHVSTGALLRSEAARRTPLGMEAASWTRRGLLVPDELAIRLITLWIAGHGTTFLFDGFPRTVGQSEQLDVVLAGRNTPLDLIILLELSEDEIRQRIAERLSCLKCGATFSAPLHGALPGKVCPRCGDPLIRRDDDTTEALNERLRVYREITLPVVEYYERTSSRLFHRLAAEQGSDVIFAAISRLVEKE